MMKPFFTYFGGKHVLAKRIGPPQRDHVIEPFAGSAGYSCFWQPKRVTLIEKDPIIFGIWNYLTRVSAAEILALPANANNVEDIAHLPPEAQWLIRFWYNHGLPRPGNIRSNWARQPRRRASFWSETIKQRLARQIELIRHWKIIHGDYTQAPDIDAHWHIDPPYSGECGQQYSCRDVDYEALAEWCRSRKGFVQVCENFGADWLEFEEYAWIANRFGSDIRREAVCEFETTAREELADA